MDPLSSAASVIAVLQISGQVFSLCREYYMAVKDARKDIQRLRDEVTSLEVVLTNVWELAEDPGSGKVSALGLLSQQDGPMQQCKKYLKELVEKLEHNQGDGNMKRSGVRALKWPFSSKECEKILTTLGRHRAIFNLALTADNV
jgi:hypothetical protein